MSIPYTIHTRRAKRPAKADTKRPPCSEEAELSVSTARTFPVIAASIALDMPDSVGRAESDTIAVASAATSTASTVAVA